MSNRNQTPDRLPQDARRDIPTGFILHKTFQGYWPNVVVGIACWMGSWPLVYSGTIFLLRSIETGSLVSKSSEEILVWLFAITLAWILLGFLALLVGTIFALISNAAMATFQVYGPLLENDIVACVTGGLTGLGMSLPTGPWRETEISIESIFALVIATILGQVGGTRGALKIASYRKLVTNPQPDKYTPVQFSLRQVMTVTIWLAITLTMMRLAGMFTPSWGVFLGTWLALQAFAVGMILILRGRRRNAAM